LFFPPQLAPFGYNETQGAIYMPLTKEEAVSRGYKWEDNIPGTFGKETLKPQDIPDRIEDILDTILSEILACKACGRNYNIARSELDFYRHQRIPVPRLCPECRYRSRINLRLPRKLWHRKCQCAGKKSEIRNEKLGTGYAYENTIAHFHGSEGCPNEFETSYAPERSEIVYCEQCYNAEVV
jgi:hypothetical protein